MREERNWAELPPDVLSVIFGKVGVIDILLSTQYVCRPWRQLSFNPSIWKVIDMAMLPGDDMDLDLEKMVREAVDRSQGQLEFFCLKYFGSDALLHYIADRSTDLRGLRLVSTYDISDKGLSEMLRQFPQLEQLEITLGSFSEKICEYVGKACPLLKLFRLNTHNSIYMVSQDERYMEALAIANRMPELRHLQLFGNNLTNKGLTAILEKCIHLEYLDIRCCFHVNLDANLVAKCAKLKDLRGPDDQSNLYLYGVLDVYEEASDLNNGFSDDD